MPKLYEHPFSPYVQKVKIALYEKNVAFEVEVPDAFSGAPTEYAKTNPRLEVPTLVDDGFAIFDSTIILDYIEEKWPTPAICSDAFVSSCFAVSPVTRFHARTSIRPQLIAS